MYTQCLASVVFGSDSDLPIFCKSRIGELYDFVIGDPLLWDLSVFSAERHAETTQEYCARMVMMGVKTVIGVAGLRPVLPVVMKSLVTGWGIWTAGVSVDGDGVSTLTQNPTGSDLGFYGIGAAGLYNAALASCHYIAQTDPSVNVRLADWLKRNAKKPMLYIDHRKLKYDRVSGRVTIPDDWEKFPIAKGGE